MSEKPFIVAGLDGSEQSIHACRWAVEHARLLGADVHIVGAWQVPATIFLTPTWQEEDYGNEARRAFEESLAEVLAGEQAAHVRPYLIRGRSRAVLLEAAEGATSLVIGSHGRGNSYPGMHIGSTANFLVHHAPCPVVVVRG